MKTKTFLITGGTTGIGLATAQLLQGDGAQVIVTGRNPATLAEARAALGPTAIILASDSGKLADALALGEAVRAHTTRLDGVFLNAGIGQFFPLELTSAESFQAMFDVNVRGPFFQLQGLLPLLGAGSTVVLNASVAGFLAFPSTSAYAATKGAVAALGRVWAAELAGRGIRVNTISPGPIKTPIYGKLGMPSDVQAGFEAAMAQGSLLKRFGTPEEVAKLARFLLTDESSYIVGEEIVIDGGVQLT